MPVDSQGMDNATYRVGDEIVVPVPPVGRAGGARAALAAVPGRGECRCGLRSARPGRPGLGYPFSWSVYRWIEEPDANPGP